jgi:hypothetical protein
MSVARRNTGKENSRGKTPLHAKVVPVVQACRLEVLHAGGQTRQKESKVGVPGANGGVWRNARSKGKGERWKKKAHTEGGTI